MRYVSTRGRAPALDFRGIVLAGLADDGGLYVPEAWPTITAEEFRRLRGRSYQDVAVAVLERFVGNSLDRATLTQLVEDAYRGFAHEAIAPLRQIGANEWLLELFHGPTLAFKDIALQLLGRLMDYFLSKSKSRLVIVGATSGDTGSAAIEACRDRSTIEIFILHPRGRISAVQRQQMTTVLASNIHNIAVDGTFDDCQALVKSLFADTALRLELNLGAVNSINWARIAAQVVYYVSAALALGAPERSVAFAVPTGNFGDVYAGFCARRLGLPISRLAVATNRNDILARFFATGDYRPAGVVATMSPSMDIQVASNFERLLYDLYDGDGAGVAGLMSSLGQSGAFSVEPARLARASELFVAGRADENETIATMQLVAHRSAAVIDPHTAVGVSVGRRRHRPGDGPLVCLATAHPAKFSDAVRQALGREPELPPEIAALGSKPERYDTIANDIDVLKDYVRANA
ncbi:MAG: threonine synthase [Alphaproteobacteria bacterium]|nr:threonine synthase [Alphaproteobacteria bacterium]